MTTTKCASTILTKWGENSRSPRVQIRIPNDGYQSQAPTCS
jgi:hypothetical protein